MTDINKESISVLNDLIETSKDGQKGFATCAEDIKHPELKALFQKRSADCATAAAELQTAVRALGGKAAHAEAVAGVASELKAADFVTTDDDHSATNSSLGWVTTAASAGSVASRIRRVTAQRKVPGSDGHGVCGTLGVERFVGGRYEADDAR